MRLRTCATWTLGCFCALLGCSTPQPFYEEAKASADLMARLQAEMDGLSATQSAIAASRRASLDDMAALRISNDSGENRFPARWALAGMTDKATLFNGLQSLAGAQAADADALESNLAAAHTAIATLLSPLPSTTKDMAKAKADMTAISVPPTAQERIKFLGQYVQAVKADIASAASAAASSAAAAASAAASAPPVKAPSIVRPATPKV